MRKCITDLNVKKPLEKLTESPIIQLDAADLNNPDSIDFKQKIKDQLEAEKAAKEKEEAERVAKEKADAEEKKKQELKTKYKDLTDLLNKALNSDADFSNLFDVVVPSSGMADTVGGEMVRAIGRLEYRYYNDGDLFYTGYGIETCADSAMYLFDKGFEAQIKKMVENSYMSEKEYENSLKDLKRDVIEYLQQKPEKFEELNDEDSRSGQDVSYIKENQPMFDAELDFSDDVLTLINNNIVSRRDIASYLEDMMRYDNVFEDCSDATVEVNNYGASIYNLTSEAYETIQEYTNNIDKFWEDFVEDYREDLNNLDAEDSDDTTTESLKSELDDNMDFKLDVTKF